MSNYLDTDKSIIISAPAGSGKTEKLARRYIALLQKGVDVERILAITFTDKAAAEMKQRILKILRAEDGELFVKLLDHVYNAVGLKYSAKLSTRPPQRIGSDDLWDRAEAVLREALANIKLDYELKEGDGAFYGPKIDFDVSDSIGRKWQLGTVQLDYNAPERFDLTYVGEDNREHRPVVLHRAIYGSFERFIAILIEHFAGAFPVWLAPVQVRLVTVADRQLDFAKEVQAQLADKGYRVEVDERNLSMQKKIAEAQVQKIPFTLIIGDREVEQRTVAPRRYGGAEGQGAQSQLGVMSVGDFLTLLEKEARLP